MITIEQKKANGIVVRGFVNGMVNMYQAHTHATNTDFIVVEKSSIPALIDALQKEME